MRQGADGLAEIGSLTIDSSCVLEHAYHETKLTQQAVFTLAVCSDVAFGKSTYRHSIVHCLQERIRVRIEDVCFEPAVQRLVVEAVGCPVKAERDSERTARARTQNQSPLHQTLNTQSRLCDTHVGYLKDAIDGLENPEALAFIAITCQ